jgi:hypothetical protein
MGTDPWDPFICSGDRSSVLRGLTVAVRSRLLERELTGGNRSVGELALLPHWLVKRALVGPLF